jgi:hypothetical protein
VTETCPDAPLNNPVVALYELAGFGVAADVPRLRRSKSAEIAAGTVVSVRLTLLRESESYLQRVPA